MKIGRWFMKMFLVVAAVALLPMAAFAAAPVVKTVPWVASDPLTPHDTYAGKSIRLKGTTDITTGTYSWDFGDGTATAAITITDKYALEASHVCTQERLEQSGVRDSASRTRRPEKIPAICTMSQCR